MNQQSYFSFSGVCKTNTKIRSEEKCATIYGSGDSYDIMVKYQYDDGREFTDRSKFKGGAGCSTWKYSYTIN